MIQAGDRVRILYPKYVAGETGVILQAEILHHYTKSGYWLVQVENQEIIVALLNHEMELIQ